MKRVTMDLSNPVVPFDVRERRRRGGGLLKRSITLDLERIQGPFDQRALN